MTIVEKLFEELYSENLTGVIGSNRQQQFATFSRLYELVQRQAGYLKITHLDERLFKQIFEQYQLQYPKRFSHDTVTPYGGPTYSGMTQDEDFIFTLARHEMLQQSLLGFARQQWGVISDANLQYAYYVIQQGFMKQAHEPEIKEMLKSSMDDAHLKFFLDMTVEYKVAEGIKPDGDIWYSRKALRFFEECERLAKEEGYPDQSNLREFADKAFESRQFKNWETIQKQDSLNAYHRRADNFTSIQTPILTLAAYRNSTGYLQDSFHSNLRQLRRELYELSQTSEVWDNNDVEKKDDLLKQLKLIIKKAEEFLERNISSYYEAEWKVAYQSLRDEGLPVIEKLAEMRRANNSKYIQLQSTNPPKVAELTLNPNKINNANEQESRDNVTPLLEASFDEMSEDGSIEESFVYLSLESEARSMANEEYLGDFEKPYTGETKDIPSAMLVQDEKDSPTLEPWKGLFLYGKKAIKFFDDMFEEYESATASSVKNEKGFSSEFKDFFEKCMELTPRGAYPEGSLELENFSEKVFYRLVFDPWKKKNVDFRSYYKTIGGAQMFDPVGGSETYLVKPKNVEDFSQSFEYKKELVQKELRALYRELHKLSNRSMEQQSNISSINAVKLIIGHAKDNRDPESQLAYLQMLRKDAIEKMLVVIHMGNTAYAQFVRDVPSGLEDVVHPRARVGNFKPRSKSLEQFLQQRSKLFERIVDAYEMQTGKEAIEQGKFTQHFTNIFNLYQKFERQYFNLQKNKKKSLTLDDVIKGVIEVEGFETWLRTTSRKDFFKSLSIKMHAASLLPDNFKDHIPSVKVAMLNNPLIYGCLFLPGNVQRDRAEMFEPLSFFLRKELDVLYFARDHLSEFTKKDAKENAELLNDIKRVINVVESSLNNDEIFKDPEHDRLTAEIVFHSDPKEIRGLPSHLSQ